MVGAIFSGIEIISKMWKSFTCPHVVHPKKDNAFFLKVHIKNVILGSFKKCISCFNPAPIIEPIIDNSKKETTLAPRLYENTNSVSYFAYE